MKQKDKYDVVLSWVIMIVTYVAVTFIIIKILLSAMPSPTRDKPAYDKLYNDGGHHVSKAA